ncbi:MAG: hypothetical protein AAFX65_11665 [Cyanobacteria bacterium J06638_7]
MPICATAIDLIAERLLCDSVRAGGCSAGYSTRQSGKVLGVGDATVKRDLKKADSGCGPSGPHAVPGPAHPKTPKRPPADPQEIEQAWLLRDDGLSNKTIAERLGRGVKTITSWFKRPRPASSGHPPHDHG